MYTRATWVYVNARVRENRRECTALGASESGFMRFWSVNGEQIISPRGNFVACAEEEEKLLVRGVCAV